jgi:hypothetical protein
MWSGGSAGAQRGFFFCVVKLMYMPLPFKYLMLNRASMAKFSKSR